ncbi:MAG: hypothetical protein QCI38_06380, partial [Candidatus Thermoplasmatota archaeon]|nr:hypothetical protein [Candidatus Thermoplasmatota archaeon]
LGFDSNGDGTWDYVNPAHDFDGDGNPDTGILLMGGSFPITVMIQIPADAEYGTDVTTITVTDRRMTVSDFAIDVTTVIPNFSSVAVPIAAVLVLFWASNRKKTGSKEKGKGRGKKSRSYVAKKKQEVLR